MSIESNDLGGTCGVCDCVVLDYEPGVSATKIDGVWYHPACARREGILLDEPIEIDLTKALVNSLNREQRAIAEAADHVALANDHDHLLDPDDGPADWHVDEKPKLPDDEGPTREKYDAEAELDVAESKRLLQFAMKAMVNAIETLRNEMYDRRVSATIADLSNALAEIDREVSFV
jgi:hypothetical protein